MVCIPTYIASEEYQNHQVFDVLGDLSKFYQDLSLAAFSFVGDGIEYKMPFNYETYIFSSLGNTLDSISLLLREGHINDAFALLRKYDDGILNNLYIKIYIQKHRTKLTSLVLPKINKWVYEKEPLPSSAKILDYINSYSVLSEINRIVDLKGGKYKALRRICNDNTHYNSLYFMLLNDKDVALSTRHEELEKICNCIIHFFIFHFVYLFLLEPAYMVASDYLDYLDCGQTPSEDLLKLVAPYIQECFDKYVMAYNPEMGKYLKQNSNLK